MNLRIRKIYFLVVVVLCSVTKGYNQIVTSIGNGLWTDPTIWDSGQVPTPLNATSTIVNHELEIPGAASVSVQNVTVYGRLTVSSAAIVDVIADGLPDKWDLQVFGNLVMNDGATLNGTSLLNTSFESGARYIHFQGPLGFIPYATWHSNSTFEIAGFRTQGYINIAHSDSWKQNFGHVIYNCPQQTTAFVDLNGYLRNVAGNFIVQNTNNHTLRLSTTQSPAIEIGGDFVIQGQSKIWLSTTPTNAVITVNGNLRYNSTSSGISYLTTKGAVTLEVRGEMELNSPGRIHMASTSPDSTGTRHAKISLHGNLRIEAGSIVAPPPPGKGEIVFMGIGTQNVIASPTGGSFQGNIEYSIETDAIVNLGTSALSNASGDLFVRGTLQVGSLHPAGAIQSAGAGNILVRGNRNYESSSTIEYNGMAEQSIGDGHPNDPDVNLICSNVSGTHLLNEIVVSSLTVTGPLDTHGLSMTIAGNLIAGEGVTFNPSRINMQGAMQQLVSAPGTLFKDIHINKSANSVVLTAPLYLSGYLIIESTNTTLQSNGNLLLMSTSDDFTGTASIGPIPAGSAIAGNVTFQRHMSGEGRIYRYISSPVQEGTVASLKDDFSITGRFLDPSNGSKSPSFYFYDETVGDLQLGWRPYPTSGLASENPLVVGKGYAAFIRRATETTTWDVTGVLNQGSINLPLSFTADQAPFNGWNLVGNPYASAIEWNASVADQWLMNNISAVVAIRDNGGGGFFRYFDLFDEGEPTGGQIAAGQSFWVRATAPNPELVIHEGAKTIKGAIFFRTQSLAVSNFSISLSRDSLTDIAYYKIRPQAHAKLDNWDGLKLDNDHFDISFISNDNRSLAIQATSKFPCDTIIPIGLKDLKPGLYRLSVEAKRLFLRYNFTVLDKYTGTALILEPGEHVELRVTNDRESYAFDRISLRLIERELRRDVLLEGPPTVCVSQPFDLEVKGAEEGVRYSLSAGDREICSGVKVNASDALNFQISSDTLGLGQHVLRMKAMSGCHIIDLSSSYKLTVSESPKVFADSSITCMNEPAVLTAFCDQEEATFYWFEDESTRDTLARGNRFVTPPLRKSKTYFVSALTDGCTSDHHPVKAYIITYKPAMISMVTDTVLASNYSNNNLWYHQGEKVGGGRYLSITASGSYILEVDSLGCFSRDTLEIIVMNLETPVGKSLIVYPNPSNKDIYIEDLREEVVKIEIVNDKGQLALQQEGRTDQRLYHLGLEMLSPGRYTLIVLTRFGKKIFRIVRSP